MTTDRVEKRPKNVTIAISMMYLVVVLGIVRTSMTVLRHLEVRTPDLYIGGKVLIYVVSVFLIYQAGKGSNWARWSLTLLLLISIPLGVLPTFDAIAHSPLHTLLGFTQTGLYVVALVFLFHRDSSTWFKPNKTPDS